MLFNVLCTFTFVFCLLFSSLGQAMTRDDDNKENASENSASSETEEKPTIKKTTSSPQFSKGTGRKNKREILDGPFYLTGVSAAEAVNDSDEEGEVKRDLEEEHGADSSSTNSSTMSDDEFETFMQDPLHAKIVPPEMLTRVSTFNEFLKFHARRLEARGNTILLDHIRKLEADSRLIKVIIKMIDSDDSCHNMSINEMIVKFINYLRLKTRFDPEEEQKLIEAIEFFQKAPKPGYVQKQLYENLKYALINHFTKNFPERMAPAKELPIVTSSWANQVTDSLLASANPVVKKFVAIMSVENLRNSVSRFVHTCPLRDLCSLKVLFLTQWAQKIEETNLTRYPAEHQIYFHNLSEDLTQIGRRVLHVYCKDN